MRNKIVDVLTAIQGRYARGGGQCVGSNMKGRGGSQSGVEGIGCCCHEGGQDGREEEEGFILKMNSYS